MTTKPNFFIVGQSKAGTTSMYNYFKEHPDVYMSEVKGPNAFGIYENDFSKKYNTKDKKAYLNLFKTITTQKIKGEASIYFYDEQAIKELKEFNPKAKILILIRNPIDIINSHYNYDNIHKIKGGSTIIECLQNLQNYPEGKVFSEVLRYTHYIKLWQKHFTKKQVYVSEFNELMSNLPKNYSRICEWLNIDDQFQPRFIKHNPARKFDEEKLKSVIKRTHKLPVGFRVFLKKTLPKGFQEKLKERITESITIKKGKTKIDNETKQYILKKYAEEIKDLEKLLNKDLSKWKNK